jgi:predicted amidohydrolase
LTPFAIAGVQMPIAAAHSNVDAMLHRIDLVLARFPWVQMVLFSELAPHGPLLKTAEPQPSATEARFQEAAKRHGIWLIPGSVFERAEDGQVFNMATVIDPAGEVIARYRKMFPFYPYEQGVAPGAEFCIFDVPEVGRFGLSICYDIWFPETTRSLTAAGVEVLLHPVLTGTIDRDIELSIARATAAQFQCYVFDINGLGAGGVGRSTVIDPAGTVVIETAGQEEYLALEIDLDQVRRQRETGGRGRGQLLKSFRDRAVELPVYDRDSGAAAYLDRLGPLRSPRRGEPVTLAPRPDRPAAPATTGGETEASKAPNLTVMQGAGRNTGGD